MKRIRGNNDGFYRVGVCLNPSTNSDGFVIGAGDAVANNDDGGFRDILLEQDCASEVAFGRGQAELGCGVGPALHDEDFRSEAFMIKARGFEGAGIDPAAKDDDGIGFGEWIGDNPKVGEATEEWRTKQPGGKAEN